MTTTFFEGLGALPHFNPDDDHDSAAARRFADLRSKIAAADALLFCVPEYAGALPGSLKNLLDWTVGGVETSGKPAGWINISTAGGGAAGAHAELADGAAVHRCPLDRGRPACTFRSAATRSARTGWSPTRRYARAVADVLDGAAVALR